MKLTHHAAAGDVSFDWQEESYGTRPWFALLGPLLLALDEGAVLLVDELDASLHSRFAAEVVRLLHDPYRVRAISTVAVQQVNVNPSRLRELEIDLPVDLAELRRIVATLEACDGQIGREMEELNKLREPKHGLVDDLLWGRIAVSAVAA